MWLVLRKYKFPIEWSIKTQSPANSGWFSLASGDVSWGDCQYKHLVCALPWAPPAAPPLWNNLVGAVFASRCCAGCWGWAGGAIVWELLPKIRISLASKTSMWQGTLSTVCLPASIYWQGGMNGTQPDFRELEKANDQVWAFAQTVPVWNNLTSAWLFLKNICGFVNIL